MRVHAFQHFRLYHNSNSISSSVTDKVSPASFISDRGVLSHFNRRDICHIMRDEVDAGERRGKRSALVRYVQGVRRIPGSPDSQTCHLHTGSLPAPSALY